MCAKIAITNNWLYNSFYPKILEGSCRGKLKYMTKQLLFCPGPVNLADNVKKAAIQADICHREKEFEQTMKRLRKNVLKVFEIARPSKYAAVFVTGSGTAGNETIISSLGTNKRILVLTNGEFGERLLAIAQTHHKYVKQISFDWGTQMNLETVEKYLKTHKVDAVLMVHHETSSGLLNPITAIGQLAHKYNAKFVVDAVSSGAAEKVEIEKSYITFLNTTSGKAISSFPGIALIIGRKDAFEALKNEQPKTAYLNLYKFYHYAESLNQTPNTPGVQLFFALDAAIQNIVTEGVAQRRERIYKMASYIRKNLQEMGLTFLLSENMSSVVTSVMMPKGLTFTKVQSALRKKNIIIYNGKGPFKDKIFQVGHIGEITMKDADYFLSSLKEILEKPLQKRKKKEKTVFMPGFSFVEFTQNLPRAIAGLFF